jgi:hypothetical protein
MLYSFQDGHVDRYERSAAAKAWDHLINGGVLRCVDER